MKLRSSELKLKPNARGLAQLLLLKTLKVIFKYLSRYERELGLTNPIFMYEYIYCSLSLSQVKSKRRCLWTCC